MFFVFCSEEACDIKWCLCHRRSIMNVRCAMREIRRVFTWFMALLTEVQGYLQNKKGRILSSRRGPTLSYLPISLTKAFINYSCTCASFTVKQALFHLQFVFTRVTQSLDKKQESLFQKLFVQSMAEFNGEHPCSVALLKRNEPSRVLKTKRRIWAKSLYTWISIQRILTVMSAKAVVIYGVVIYFQTDPCSNLTYV